MWAWQHLALFAAALATAKYGILDRRSPLLTMPASMVLFAAFSMGSFSVQLAERSEPLSQPGIFVLGLGGTFIMLAYTIAEATDRLPSPDDDDDQQHGPGQHPMMRAPRQQRGPNPERTNGDD